MTSIPTDPDSWHCERILIRESKRPEQGVVAWRLVVSRAAADLLERARSVERHGRNVAGTDLKEEALLLCAMRGSERRQDEKRAIAAPTSLRMNGDIEER
eukprot:675144-Pleurochrysis_carterae.AAC.10